MGGYVSISGGLADAKGMAHLGGYSMRFTINGLGLRWRTGVSRLDLIQGFLVLLIVAAAGCGDAEPSATVEPGVPTQAPASASAPAQTALPGHATWVLDSLDGRPLIDESIVTLKVDENWFGGFDGCNSYGGRSEDETSIADADGMFSNPPLERTAMECVESEGIMDQADAYTSAPIQGERFRVVGDRLEIFDRGGEARLVFVREAPLSGRPNDLGGTAWRLLTEGGTNGDLRAATLAFLDDRLATGATACRAYLATYSISEGSVRFPSQSMLPSPVMPGAVPKAGGRVRGLPDVGEGILGKRGGRIEPPQNPERQGQDADLRAAAANRRRHRRLGMALGGVHRAPTTRDWDVAPPGHLGDPGNRSDDLVR